MDIPPFSSMIFPFIGISHCHIWGGYGSKMSQGSAQISMVDWDLWNLEIPISMLGRRLRWENDPVLSKGPEGWPFSSTVLAILRRSSWAHCKAWSMTAFPSPLPFRLAYPAMAAVPAAIRLLPALMPPTPSRHTTALRVASPTWSWHSVRCPKKNKVQWPSNFPHAIHMRISQKTSNNGFYQRCFTHQT